MEIVAGSLINASHTNSATSSAVSSAARAVYHRALIRAASSGIAAALVGNKPTFIKYLGP